MQPVLEIQDLAITFDTEEGEVLAVSDVSFKVETGQTLGIVGESGCGKTVSCHAILGLTPENGSVSAGEIYFEGKSLVDQTSRHRDAVRGKDIAMIFQDPASALNRFIRLVGKLPRALFYIGHCPPKWRVKKRSRYLKEWASRWRGSL